MPHIIQVFASLFVVRETIGAKITPAAHPALENSLFSTLFAAVLTFFAEDAAGRS